MEHLEPFPGIREGSSFVTGTLTMTTIGVRSIPLYDEAEPAAAAKKRTRILLLTKGPKGTTNGGKKGEREKLPFYI